MKRPKVLIIVLFQNLGDAHPYYALSPAPPLPGLLLAGMTPDIVDVDVLHEMVRPIDYSTDADCIALSFLDYLAPHAYEVAARFRALGKTVMAGGKFASTHPEEVATHFDSICVGEAQEVWPRMVRDYVNGTLQSRYVAPLTPSLENIPVPRYDLAEKVFTTAVVVEASRGCPHPCTYCALNIRRTPFRKRPVADVVRDLASTGGLPWIKRKTAMIVDNNFGGDLAWAKEVLRGIAGLGYWAVGIQFSIECLRDEEFVDLLAAANCRMAFIGMESLNTGSLAGVMKRQNVVSEYREAFEKLHRRGILTFTGMMFGLEGDTPEYYATLPERLEEAGPSVILPSITIPIYGTALYREVESEGRIIDRDLSHYEGDHLVFRHRTMTAAEIDSAFTSVTSAFYAWPSIVRRWWKFMRLQSKREGAAQFLIKLAVTTFVYYKLSVFQRHHAKQKILSKGRVVRNDTSAALAA
jgi:radical SAM superfamily enzyme YgiQ (UPF0313 family)